MDIIHDNNLSRLYGMLKSNPEATALVKTASLLSEEEWDAYPDTAFADTAKREFPIVDGPHTAISIMYAHKYGAAKDTWSNLRTAASVYDIDEAVLVPTSKTASTVTPRTYLLAKQQKYPIYGEFSVKKAEDYFVNYCASMQPDVRKEYGDSLVKVAKDFSVELSPKTLQLAGHTMTDVKLARDMMFTRSAYVNGTKIKDAYMKVASLLESASTVALDKASQDELVALIWGIDKLAGLDRKYSSKLPSPESTVFNTSKVAAYSFGMGPYTVTPEKLARIDTGLLGDIIGNDMVDAMSKQGELDYNEASSLLPTLPRDIQNVVARTFSLR